MFEAVERKIERQAPVFSRETNDLLIHTKDRKNKDKTTTLIDLLKFSKAVFVSTGIIDQYGILMLRNNATQSVYIATVPEKVAKAFAGRKDADKSQEASYNEVVTQLAEYGLLPAERPRNFKAAFDVVAISEEELVEAKKASEHIVNVYKLVPAELVEPTAKKEATGDEATGEETAEAAQDSASEEPSDIEVTDETADESADEEVTDEY